MPLYKYKGTTTYVNNLYDIKVEPGEIFLTPYVLPNEWKDFELLGEDTGDLLPYTQLITITNKVELDLSKYSRIWFFLTNYGEASVKISFVLENKCVILDRYLPRMTIERKNTYNFSKAILDVVEGEPQVKILFSFI